MGSHKLRGKSNSAATAKAAGHKSLDTSGHSLSRWLGESRTGQIRDALAKGGVRMKSAHIGELKTPHFTATVTLEADDTVRVRTTHTTVHEDLLTAIESCTGLRGSARFATGPHGRLLAAETRLNGVAHLPASLKDIRYGFLKLLGKRVRRAGGEPDEPPSPASAVKAAIDEAGWDTDRALETDAGWELRPRLSGQTVPVELVLDVETVHLRKTIVSPIPDGSAGFALAHQALTTNDRLRGCRLAIADDRLVAECTLRPSLINADWLAHTAATVAAAARTVEPEFRLLATNPAIVEQYLEMFVSSDHLPAETPR